jgi:hypothetical protein
MSQTLQFSQEPILVWKKHGVYIYEKGYEYDKNIFIYFQSLVAVTYGEKKIINEPSTYNDDIETSYVQSHIILNLSNGVTVTLIFDDETPYIYEYFQNLTDGHHL